VLWLLEVKEAEIAGSASEMPMSTQRIPCGKSHSETLNCLPWRKAKFTAAFYESQKQIFV
jgi:hypothetical protein